MAKINTVIAGSYSGQRVVSTHTSLCIGKDLVRISKGTVESFEVVDADEKFKAASAIGRAAGVVAFGSIGIFAALTGKTKREYTIDLYFKDCRRSRIFVDEKICKELLTMLL